MLQFHLCKGFDNLLGQDDKGDVSTETTGPARADISADRFGPGFGAFLVQCLLEEYADLIALPVVFSSPAEVGASAEPVAGSLLPGTSSVQKYPPRTSCGQPITRHF
ncbi:hypothetical protein V6N13_024739 [Hibiscus sabdariffa]